MRARSGEPSMRYVTDIPTIRQFKNLNEKVSKYEYIIINCNQ